MAGVRAAVAGFGSQLVGLHTGGAFDESGINESLMFPAEQGGLADTVLGSYGGNWFTRSQPANDLLANCRRIHTGHVTS